MPIAETYLHRRLKCGVEFAALPIEGRRTTAYEIRVLAGLVDEPDDRLGLARIVDETIDKGTERLKAQEVSDAFDAIGADHSSGVGRESFLFRCNCLPEYVEQALSLHAEMLRTPTFPDEFVKTAVELSRQELTALEDEPGELARKLVGPHALGRLLGRHELGTREALDRLSREDVVGYWSRHFRAVRMQVAIAGAVDVEAMSSCVERLFSGFGDGGADGPSAAKLEFSPGAHHHQKELEQQHVLLCWPGVGVCDRDYAIERVALTILGRGMSSRLFTEVREKQGLVYSVGAWDEHPRRGGVIFVAASTRPAYCDRTIRSLLHEVDRLSEDVTEEELDRAKARIIAKAQTHGDITRARSGELSSDLFYYGRPVPLAEKNERVAAVSIADIRRYLAEHPRDHLCMLTLGPREIENAELRV